MAPNVLLMVADDLRIEVGAYGYAHMRTPHIDGLAAQGVRFAQAYASWPVCAPSRASIMSGWTPDRMGFHDCCACWRTGYAEAKESDLPSIFTTLTAAGYVTGAFGKVTGSDPQCFVPGEIAGCGGPNDPACLAAGRQWMGHDGGGDGCRTGDGRKNSWCEVHDESWPWDGDEPDQLTTDAANAWLSVRLQEQAQSVSASPFFAWVGFMRPHLPFNSPARKAALGVQTLHFRVPPTILPTHARYTLHLRSVGRQVTSRATRQCRKRHLRNIRSTRTPADQLHATE